MYVCMYSTYTWLAVGFTEHAAGHVTVQCAENIFHERVAVRSVREKWWTQGEAGRYSKLDSCYIWCYCTDVWSICSVWGSGRVEKKAWIGSTGRSA